MWFEIWLSKRTEKLEITLGCALCDFKFFRALWAKSQITPLRRVMFAINTTTTSSWVCFNPKRTEKPCALGFSVRFGLKHTLRCVIWVKSWKLEALIWVGSGVRLKTTEILFCDLHLHLHFHHHHRRAIESAFWWRRLWERGRPSTNTLQFDKLITQR